MSVSPKIEGYPLRPPCCCCTFGCRSREEMRARHGTPDEFVDALSEAVGDGVISFSEAERANLMYRGEWNDAPETTEINKP